MAALATQTRRARYIGSLKEAQREVALARHEVAKANEKTWGYQELLQSAGTIDGPDCSPVGPLPTPNKNRRLSLMGMLRPSAKKGASAVAPSPAATSISRRMSILDVERSEMAAPKKEDTTLGLMSAALGPRLSGGKLNIDSADAPAAPETSRQVLSPRGANSNSASTPRYGQKSDGSSESLSAKKSTPVGTGTPKYGSSKKEQQKPLAAPVF